MFITTKITGIYVFDQEKLVEKVDFPDLSKANTKLENKEWLKEEKDLIKKYPNSIYVGFKKEKLEGTKFSQDPKKLEIIKNYIHKKDLNELFNRNLILTKRAVRASVENDLLIIHTIKAIKELKTVANRLAKRLREWYEVYNPEFSKSISSHEKFTELILKNDREKLLKDINIKETMGADLGSADLNAIKLLAEELSNEFKLIKSQEKYLENLMKKTCPNMQTVAGTLTGAKLLELAGSLKKMARFPSSTIQLLGAEKALFRHLKTKSKPPKFGIIAEHPYVAQSKAKGKAARTFANKISIAVKVDYNKGKFIGDKLVKQLK